MLEAYPENYDPEEIIAGVMEKRGVKRTAALAICRKEIPKEGYFQAKVIKALAKKYPSAYIVKIAQGAYSQAGVPDIMCIVDGHYFGFEIKRPIVGEASKLQEMAIRKIAEAGGTAAIVSYPEQAIKVIEAWRV